ncbi:hypothetical protein [Algibacter lectus]|uniref:Lipocalin-like domain-containing protein n=1 Tax=Algibacter lectus TaxID=221126 RepID=A0A4R8MBD4_9FLAO|nr:hypothetical protein [Algibacter lectus]MWW25754.1 hypothetical protein [Algibacter lectus]TDY61036.1 hypothetical protein DFQ06_3047 [Algibacter lectus]
MKTKIKFIVLLLFLAITSFCNAQDATEKETIDWIFKYGTELFKDGYNLVYTYENDKMYIHYSSRDDGQLKSYTFEWEDLKSVTAMKGENSVLIFWFKTKLNGYLSSDISSNKEDSSQSQELNFRFKSDEKLLRFYKSINHLCKVKQLTEVKFNEDFTIKNKF